MIKKQPVICLETGEKFESLNECARIIGIHPSFSYSAITDGHAARGITISMLRNRNHLRSSSTNPRKKAVKVRCIETGEVFESSTQAMEKTGINRKDIYRAINNKAGGFHWEAVDD